MKALEYLKSRSLNEVERMFMNGYISADDWETYCYLWRNSCGHFSNELIGYEDNRYEHTLENAIAHLADGLIYTNRQ